jgi:hypothetical protein
MFVWVALAAAMGLAAGGFFVVYPRAVASSSHDEATSLTVPTAPAPSQVPPSSRPVPDSLATFGDADVEAAPNPSGARVMGSSPATPPIPPTKPTSGKSPAPTLHGGSPRTSGGKASTPLAPSNPADEPDDISRNPYR